MKRKSYILKTIKINDSFRKDDKDINYTFSDISQISDIKDK